MKAKLEILGPTGEREERTIEVRNYYEAEIAADAIAVSEHKGVVVNRAEEEPEDKGGFLKRLLGG